jgi:hypothetical protein
MKIMESFHYSNWVWERTDRNSAWSSENGFYIVERADVVPFEVSIRSIPGGEYMVRPLKGKKLDKSQYLDLKVVARRKEAIDEEKL